MEDNILNQEVAKRWLEKTGVTVTVAANGAEAVSLVDQRRFDLVLMDLQMPVMDGFEATRRIRKAHRDLPVIALSAAVLEADRQKARRAGMNAHLAKPIDKNELYRKLSGWLKPIDVASGDAAQIPWLEGLEGFDVARGLGLADGDPAFYLTLLHHYNDQLTDEFADLVKPPEGMDRSEAAKKAHALKGVAGAVGHTRLADMAAEMDRAFKAGEAISETLSGELRAVMQDARQRLDALPALPGVTAQRNADTAGQDANRRSAGEGEASKPVVLIVDDQPANRMVLSKLLKDDYAIVTAESGAEALQIAAGERPPSLMLLDIEMPDMDGYEVCRRVKASVKTSGIAVIFVTGRDSAQDEEMGFSLGAVDYISKPFQPGIVRARVRNHINLKIRTDLFELLSSLDALTNIPNRRSFEEHLSREWARAARKGLSLSVAMMDIDHFKLYNDHYGHGAGDDCLRLVARTLKKTLTRPTDIIARYGGEEFVALLPDTDAKGALHIGEQMRAAVEAAAIAHGYSPTAPVVTLSIGVATQIRKGSKDAARPLIDAADAALYQAKAFGRNQVCAAGGEPTKKEV